MKIKKGDFLKVLSFVRPGVGKDFETLKTFFFTGENVITYNQEISINYPFKSDFQGSVDANKLYQLLSSLDMKDDEEIFIEAKENQFIIKAENMESGIFLLPKGSLENSLKSLEQDKIKKWKKVPSDLLTGLNLCRFSASKDMTLGVLSLILIKNDEIISSDNFRISKFKMREKLDLNEDLLIPLSAASELVKHELKSFSVSEAWVHFCVENDAVFSFRRIKSEYPDVDKFFENVKGISIVLPPEVKNILRSLQVFSEGESVVDERVNFTVESKKIICKSESEKGWIKRSIPIDWKGKSFSFFINPVFLEQVLSRATRMTLSEDGRVAWFHSDNFQHVMVLPS